MAVSELPNPISSTIYFLVITFFFILGNILLRIKNKKVQNYIEIAAFKKDYLISAIYLVIIILGSYAINLVISIAMCSQSIQWGNIAMITLFPWIIILGSIYFILIYFPGWTSPFSNTIGYLVIGGLGIEEIYDKIFKTGEEAKENNELVKAIANMNSNRTKFVNQISSDLVEFIDFFYNMKDAVKDNVPLPSMGIPVITGKEVPANTPQTGGDDESNKDPIMELYRLLVIKQFIGKVAWYILAGILISSISYNLIINLSCDKSLEELNKELELKELELSKNNDVSRINVAPNDLIISSGVPIATPSVKDLSTGIRDQFGTQ